MTLIILWTATRRTDKLKENELSGTCTSCGEGDDITEDLPRPEKGTRTPNTTCKCKHDQTKHTNDLQCTECDCPKYEKKKSKIHKNQTTETDKDKTQELSSSSRRGYKYKKTFQCWKEFKIL